MNLKNSNSYLLAIHYAFFVFHLTFLVLLIPCRCCGGFCKDTSDQAIELYFRVFVMQYTNLYINIKSVSCNSLQGCAISILLMMYSLLVTSFTLIIKCDVLDRPVMAVSWLYLAACATEILLSIAYRSRQRQHMAFYTYKAVGVSRESRELLYIRKSIEIILEVVFFMSITDFIIDGFFNSKKSILYTSINCFLSMVALALSREILVKKAAATVKACFMLIILDILFLIFLLISHINSSIFTSGGSLVLYKTFSISEKILLFASLGYFLSETGKFSQSALGSHRHSNEVSLSNE